MKKSIDCIEFRKNSMYIDEYKLKFPLSLDEIEKVLGEAEIVKDFEYDGEILYVYQKLGLVFVMWRRLETLKKSGVYVDEEHNIIQVRICGRGATRDKVGYLPSGYCGAKIKMAV